MIMSSTDVDPSCSVNNLALHRLDLMEETKEANEQDLEQVSEDTKISRVSKDMFKGERKTEEDIHDGKLAQNEPAYKSLRRSIARQEHEATEAQRPHSSHGCQSTDTVTTHSNVSHPLAAIHHRPRARSPYSWSTYRSHGANMISTSPPTATTSTLAVAGATSEPLTKGHFSPTVISHNSHVQRQPSSLSKSPTLRPISPFRPPGRVRSPFRSSQLSEELPFGAEFAIISEDSELEITPRSFPAGSGTGIHGYNSSYLHRCSSSPCSSSSSSSSITRSRRPNSPMRHVSAPTSAHSSPLLAPAPTPIPTRSNYPGHFNESYPLSLSTSLATSTTTTSSPSSYYATTVMSTPTLTTLSSSSVPSTPTSTRSRSPSISSLETIPDSPRAEKEAEAALAAAEEAAVAAAAAAAAAAVAADAHQLSENTAVAGSTGVIPRISSGSGIAVRDKRKRWSVCGAESRRDLDLETIWEDQNV